MPPTSKNIKVMVLYAPEDEPYKEKLLEHLSTLRRTGAISVLDEANINADEHELGQKNELLQSAHVVLLLISSDFLASDQLYNSAVTKIMQRHPSESVVAPIIVRDCLWQDSIFGQLKALPKGGYAITDTQHWQSSDRAFKAVALGITQLLDRFTLQSDGSWRPSLRDEPYQRSQPSNTPSTDLTDLDPKTQQRIYYWFALLAGFILLLIVGSLFYYKNNKNNNNTTPPPNDSTKQNTQLQLPLNKVQGLWLSANRDETFIAKMLFKGEFVEVFSRSDNKNLSWGIERVVVDNNRKLMVDYKDWGIKFSLQTEDPTQSADADTLVFLYKSDTLKTLPVPLLNIVLVRPLLANTTPKVGEENRTGELNPIPPPDSSSIQPVTSSEDNEAMPSVSNTVLLRQLHVSPAILMSPKTAPPADATPKHRPRKPSPRNRHATPAATIPAPTDTLPAVQINPQAVDRLINPLLRSHYLLADTATLIGTTRRQP